MLTDVGHLQRLLQAKAQLIECVECSKDFKYNALRRTIEPGLYELGIECPYCKTWYHSYFITDEITKLPRKNRKERRRYTAMLKALNKRERKKRNIRKVNGRWKDATS